MNLSIFREELRSDRSYNLIWIGILLLSSVATVVGNALTLRASGSPYDVLALLLNGLSNTMNAGPIFAMILGSLVISREEDDKTIEFLLAHPVSRSEIALSKLLAYTVAVVSLSVLLALAGLILLALFGQATAHAVSVFLSLSLSVFVLMYAFGAAGMFLSMFITKGGAVVGYSIGIPLILVIVALFQTTGSPLLRTLSYLSPFRYLDVQRIADTGRVDAPFVAVTGAAAVALLLLAVARYRRKEFAV